jgi:hypothetical protein
MQVVADIPVPPPLLCGASAAAWYVAANVATATISAATTTLRSGLADAAMRARGFLHTEWSQPGSNR